jgi:hypothetical protein
MELKVLFSEDPAFALRRADRFLSSEPVLHNLILTLLRARVAQGDPGRYWIALHGEEAVGVVVQSPLEYPATLTPMGPRAVLAVVDAIAEAGVTLPGVNGDAATAASFAGQWSERCKSPAVPSRECVSTNSSNCERFPALKVTYGRQVRAIAV